MVSRPLRKLPTPAATGGFWRESGPSSGVPAVPSPSRSTALTWSTGSSRRRRTLLSSQSISRPRQPTKSAGSGCVRRWMRPRRCRCQSQMREDTSARKAFVNDRAYYASRHLFTAGRSPSLRRACRSIQRRGRYCPCSRRAAQVTSTRY
jgi:hypothetical protein